MVPTTTVVLDQNGQEKMERFKKWVKKPEPKKEEEKKEEPKA